MLAEEEEERGGTYGRVQSRVEYLDTLACTVQVLEGCRYRTGSGGRYTLYSSDRFVQTYRPTLDRSPLSMRVSQGSSKKPEEREKGNLSRHFNPG